MNEEKNRNLPETQETSPATPVSVSSDTSPAKMEIKMYGSKSVMVDFIDPTNEISRYPLNDLGCGKLFADTFSKILRFVADANVWRYYDGVAWRVDVAGIIAENCAKVLVEAMAKHISNAAHRESYVEWLSKGRKRKTMIREARSTDPLRMSSFDTVTNLFNCQNVTIDLSTVETTGKVAIRQHNPDDLITKTANVKYDPDAKCERWDKFVNEIMCGDKELAKYLQKSFGYAMAGNNSREFFMILYGQKTRNGKGTLMETVLNIVGKEEYGASLSPAGITQKTTSSNKPSPEFARLAGVRFVNVSEPDMETRLNVGMMKSLTGGDEITARMLYGNPIEYKPQYVIFINTNHLFVILDDTIFASGRVAITPFNKHFEEEERDFNLKSTFKKPENASAILNWMLEGYEMYVKEGLSPPQAAIDALIEYRRESDTIALFIEETLEKCEKSERIKTSDLYKEYQLWCAENEREARKIHAFHDYLKKNIGVSRIGNMGNTIGGYKIVG